MLQRTSNLNPPFELTLDVQCFLGKWPRLVGPHDVAGGRTSVGSAIVVVVELQHKLADSSRGSVWKSYQVSLQNTVW